MQSMLKAKREQQRLITERLILKDMRIRMHGLKRKQIQKATDRSISEKMLNSLHDSTVCRIRVFQREQNRTNHGRHPLDKRAVRDWSICIFEILYDRTNGVGERE